MARAKSANSANAMDAPLRNLALILGFLFLVTVGATIAYMLAGWSLLDALYMVVLTIYTVGFREVRPVDDLYLRAVTMAVMFLGCTGMILMTGALVQLFTASEIRNLLGGNRMRSDIARLKDHTIICGFGRIGLQLAQELSGAGAPFVIMERNEKQAAEARRLGYLCLEGDATDEAALIEVGIERARALATVLPDDATNVFITLSARSLNTDLQIISRGEAPSTERKLLHAGADRVILPTHIGAERIAELILFPATASLLRDSVQGRDTERALRDFGLEIDVAAAGEAGCLPGRTVAELERDGGFLVVRIDRGAAHIVAPSSDTVIQSGDGLVLVGRGASGLGATLQRHAPGPSTETA
jgi:Trk K+ transport system NAD-binding subunit